MTPIEFHATRQTVATRFGSISFVEKGTGPAALFVHGVPLNAYHWRHQLETLAPLRRCIAPDLMGLGYTHTAPDQALAFDDQAEMLAQFLNELGIEEVDLVGSDSGGAIAQILATRAPERIRSLTLINCDAHDNWPPAAFLPVFNLAKSGQLGETLGRLLASPAAARAPTGLGAAFEFPERLSAEVLEVYLGPVTATAERRRQIDRYVASMDCAQTLRIHAQLRDFRRPTLIAWGNGDVFFPVRWAHWLAETIPGTRKVAILEGARLFFAEERPDELCELLRAHWDAARSGQDVR